MPGCDCSATILQKYMTEKTTMVESFLTYQCLSYKIKKLTILSTLYRKAIVVFAIYRSSWLEDQPAPPLPVRLPRLQSRTLLPLLPFITSHRLPPTHTHTSKCTVCKSAPHRVTHLFTERCCSKRKSYSHISKIKGRKCILKIQENKHTDIQFSFQKCVIY